MSSYDLSQVETSALQIAGSATAADTTTTNNQFGKPTVLPTIDGVAAYGAVAGQAVQIAQRIQTSQPAPVLFSATSGTDITSTLQNYLNNIGNSITNKATYVALPPGKFILSGTITIPGDRPVYLVGAGANLTVLTWTDLGSGQYAIDVGSSGGAYPSYLQDLSINCSHSSSTPFGTLPSEMYGIHAWASCYLNRLSVAGFKAGVVIEENFQKFEECTFNSNYYGVYFIQSTSYGSQSFVNCDLTANYFAGVACDGYAKLNNTTFFSCSTGAEPYGFFREAGVANDDWITHSQFLQCRLGEFGNAAYWDDSLSSNVYSNSWMNSSGYGESNATYTISSRPSPFSSTPNANTMYLGSFYNNFLNAIPPMLVQTNQFYGNMYEGNISLDALNQGMPGLSVATCYQNRILSGDRRVILSNPDSGVTVLLGRILERGSSSFSCKIAQGTNPPLGVSYSAPGTNEAVYIQQTGQIVVYCSDGTLTNGSSGTVGSWVKATANGLVTLATGATDGSVLGVQELSSATASGGLLPVTITLRLGY